jgi:hypothetical protein
VSGDLTRLDAINAEQMAQLEQSSLRYAMGATSIKRIRLRETWAYI